MAISRPTPQQILTDLPLEAAREAAWQGFVEARVKDPIIDREQNLVAGTTGDGVLQPARLATATFQSQADGTLISLESKPVMGGVIESKRAKTKNAAKLADAVEKVVARGWSRAATPDLPAVAPIAAPGAPSAAAAGAPVYSGVMPVKQGTTLLIYGILGLLCCQILAPFTWYYSNQALKNYGDIDPGDKSTVKVARILGIIGCLFLVGRIVLLVSQGAAGR